MRIVFWVLLWPGLGLVSCESLDQEEAIPSEVLVERVVFEDERLGKQDRQEIVDVWAYVNDGRQRELVGLFTLPARIPVYKKGADLILRGGIVSDGISATRVNHAHFKEDTLKNVVQSQTFTPRFRYSRFLNFDSTFAEDFEDGNSDLVKQNASDVFFSSGAAPQWRADSVNGSSLGYMIADGDDNLLAFQSDVAYAVRFNTPVFMELHYRSSVPFFVGVKAVLPDGSEGLEYDLVLVPNEEWTKVYVGLTDEVNTYLQFPGTKFYIAAQSRGNTKAGDYIAVDNLRLTFFK